MKKFISILVITAMAASVFTGCNSNTEATEESAEQEAVQSEAQEQFDPQMTDDRQALFDAAMEGFVGVNYEPMFFLGTPASNPLGNSFLCRATVVVPDAVPYWAIVTVQDVGSSVSIEQIQVPDYGTSSTASEVALAEEQDALVPGGWQTTADLTLDSAVSDAFATAAGSELTALGVLATQVVSGTNYAILASDGANFKIVYLYVALDGSAECSNIADLSL